MNAPQVRECMTGDVVTCRPETDMERAAHLMWTHDCGVLPVLGEGDRVVGLVTDRDLVMGAYTRGGALRDLRVRDSMSQDVQSCLPTEKLEDAIRTLGRMRVRRLPVVDEQGLLQGLLSMNDVVRHVESSPDSFTRTRLEEVLLDAMASICAPRTRAPETPTEEVSTPAAAEPMPAPRTSRPARSSGALTAV